MRVLTFLCKYVRFAHVVLLSDNCTSGAADVAAGAYHPGPGAGIPDLDQEVMESISSARLSLWCKHALNTQAVP